LRTGAQTLKGCFLLVFLLLGVSPILKTLTDTVSTDSIHAMAAGMLAVNLFTHDYTTGLGHHLYVGRVLPSCTIGIDAFAQNGVTFRSGA
jgi:hypothetical protein